MAVSAGREVLIKYDTNGVGGTGASWVTIGQQRGGGLGRSSETADATHKDDSGWASAVITRIGWSVSVDGAMNPSDTAWTNLLSDWASKSKVWIQIDQSAISGGTKREGQAIITTIDEDFPEGDIVAYTIELLGDGSLSASP